MIGRKGKIHHLAETGDVQAHGAKGDGTTDDTTAIQSAADELNTVGGGQLIFGSGATYKVTSTITIYDNTHIDLNGSTLKFVFSGAGEDLQLRNNTSVVNGTIENAGSDVAGESGNNQAPIVIGQFNGTNGYDNVRLRNLTIETNRARGVGIAILGDSSNIVIENIHFPDAGNNLGVAIEAHWGFDVDNDPSPPDNTFHPYNITINNITVDSISSDGKTLVFTVNSGALTDTHYLDAGIRGLTFLTAIKYKFGLIGNSENFNIESKVSGNDQGYYGSNS